MQEIAPRLSCIATEDEYLKGDASEYPVVYVQGSDGKKWKHVTLENGGHFTFSVKSFPGEQVINPNTKSKVEGSLQFLPAGKIPVKMLHEIIAFFREVMKTMGGNSKRIVHGNLEAMAHILWTEEKGYHVGIPTQKVSGAAVSYEFDDVDGAMIVVDIHSHNTMASFFSGTDNTDDSRGVWISGVAGNLDKPNCSLKWRFNYEKEKIDLSLGEIFDFSVEAPKYWTDAVAKLEEDGVELEESLTEDIVEIMAEPLLKKAEIEATCPKEWLTKVTRQTYTVPKNNFLGVGGQRYGGGKNRGNVLGAADPLFPNQAQTAKKNVHVMAKTPVRRVTRNGSVISLDVNDDEVEYIAAINGYALKYPSLSNANNPSKKDLATLTKSLNPVLPIKGVELEGSRQGYYDALNRRCVPSGLEGGGYTLIEEVEGTDEDFDIGIQAGFLGEEGLLSPDEQLAYDFHETQSNLLSNDDEWDNWAKQLEEEESDIMTDMLGMPVISDDIIEEKNWNSEDLEGLGFTIEDLLTKGVSPEVLSAIGFDLEDIEDEDSIQYTTDQIKTWMEDIFDYDGDVSEKDMALLSVIRDAHDGLSSEGQATLAQNGF